MIGMMSIDMWIIKKWVLTNFFEETRKFISICIVVFSSPQMFNKVIFEVVMGSHIFNLGDFLAIIFKRKPLFQMWNIGSNIKWLF